jgi:hypothetical protein
LEERLHNFRGCLFSEHVSGAFLPARLLGIAQKLKPEHEILDHIFSNFHARSTPLDKFFNSEFWSDYDNKRWEGETVEGAEPMPAPADERYYRNWFKKLTKKLSPEAAETLSPLSTFRSLLMTKHILKHAEEHENPHEIAVIAGSGHTSMIAKFLKNPKLLYRYERFARKVIEKSKDKTLLKYL